MSGATYQSGPEMTPAGDIVNVERAVSLPAPGSIAKLTRGWRDDMIARHKRVAAIYEARGTSAVKKAQPLRHGDITEVSEPETVPGQHDRDGLIYRVEFVGGRFYKLRCRQLGGKQLPQYMRVLHTASYLSYIHTYDAAEAWAWRGEVPSTEANAIMVEGR